MLRPVIERGPRQAGDIGRYRRGLCAVSIGTGREAGDPPYPNLVFRLRDEMEALASLLRVASVTAVDTGYGQIADRLRRDARVQLRERTNARLLEPGSLSAGLAGPAPTFFAMDVSFIGASLVLPAVVRALAAGEAPWAGEAVVLVKPQFEAGREHVGKGGIVREEAARQLAIQKVWTTMTALGGVALEVIDSPIRGMEGNYEYLLHAWLGDRA